MKIQCARLFMTTAILVLSATLACAQEMDAADVKRVVEGKNFIFKPQWVSASQGSPRALTGEYDFTVSGDSIIAFLPYFGVAYSAPVNPAEGGIKFIAVKPGYATSTTRKGWEITIKPNAAAGIQQVYLDIFDNGNANLRVVSLNRQPISFTGYIIAGSEKPKKAF